jgi:hypothetical protein
VRCQRAVKHGIRNETEAFVSVEAPRVRPARAASTIAAHAAVERCDVRHRVPAMAVAQTS